MNGWLYNCEGCGRQGAVHELARHYECPACRWVGPLALRRRMMWRYRWEAEYWLREAERAEQDQP